jgi:glycosyltransferase involved in cell wall biosynthesis
MPFGSLPTSGGGLRCWQIYQGLKSRGIEVIASMPAFTFLTLKYKDQIPPEVREYLWEWHTQDDILKRVNPDAVIFASNWDHYNLSVKPSVPLIVDLHGSRLIETTLFGSPSDTNKKVEVFSKADCLLTAGMRQRMYFYGWLTQSGRIPEDEHFIRYIPISLAPEEFERNDALRTEIETPMFVSGGGWFPWQDQSQAIFSICDELVKRQKGCIRIFGTPHGESAETPEEKKIREIFNKVKGLSEANKNIVVEGYVGREELLQEYKKASVAVELMQYNLERELAFTTRTIEYLWCGLPVLYNHYSEISDHIRDYDAGWAVDPQDQGSVERAIAEIFDQPELVAQKSLNAKKLVKDRFTWDKTIEPLVNFLEKPTTFKASAPIKGFMPIRAPYLMPSAGGLSIVPKENNASVYQRFVYPAEGIWGIEVPCVFEADKVDGSASIEVIVYSKKGFKVGGIKKTAQELKDFRGLLVPISKFFRPRGGEEGSIRVKISSTLPANFISLGALNSVHYPITCPIECKGFKSQNELGVNNQAGSLQIYFHPGTGRLYYLRSMLERAIWMIRKGEYRRITRAIRTKLIPKVKAKLNFRSA